MSDKTVTTPDIEKVREALLRLREWGVKNLMSGGMSKEDAETFCEKDDEYILALTRIEAERKALRDDVLEEAAKYTERFDPPECYGCEKFAEQIRSLKSQKHGMRNVGRRTHRLQDEDFSARFVEIGKSHAKKAIKSIQRKLRIK